MVVKQLLNWPQKCNIFAHFWTLKTEKIEKLFFFRHKIVAFDKLDHIQVKNNNIWVAATAQWSLESRAAPIFLSFWNRKNTEVRHFAELLTRQKCINHFEISHDSL